MNTNPLTLPILFAEVLDKTPNEQENHLRERCIGHPDLLEQALRLLHHDRQAANEHFLSLVNEKTDILYSGKRIGAYRLMEVLGQGGTGTVYRAVREDDYSHEVAVKVLSLTCSRKQTRERFLKEREILARLNHPNIGSILDGGSTEDGHLYYVMPMVKGSHIDDFCETHHLTFPEKVRLIISVCETISYAHKQEVVHRDLKPANLLVTEEQTVIVVDFGLARFSHGGSVITVTGDVLGTPQYMAPELAVGNGNTATPATDIYSLGCVLYKLLAREGPFQGEHPWRTILKIVQDDPVPPSRINPGIPHDLESICLKCLHKEPIHRYKSAGDLADDLKRFLEGRPVKARQPTWLDYTLNWTYRRRWKAAVLLLCLTLGLIGGLIYNNARTHHALILAKQAADHLLDHAIKVANTPGMQRPQVEMLSNAIATYANILPTLGDDQTYLHYYQARRELAAAYYRIGAREQAFRVADQLVKDVEERYKMHNSTELTIELAQCYSQVLPHFDTAEGKAYQASLMRRTISLLEDVLKAHPEKDSVLGLITDKHASLGTILIQSGSPNDAEKEFIQAIERFKPLYLKYRKDDPQARIRYCSYLSLLWSYYYRITELQKDRGFAALKEAVAIDRSLAEDFPDRPDHRLGTIGVSTLLAKALEWNGQWNEAYSHLSEIVAAYGKLMKLYPDIPYYRMQFARHNLYLGELAFAMKQHEEAKSHFQQSMHQFEELFKLQPDEASAYLELIQIFADCPEAILRNTTMGVELSRRSTELHPQSSMAWAYYGKSLLRDGKLSHAEKALKHALSLHPDEGETAMIRICLAITFANMDKQDLAKNELLAVDQHFTKYPKEVVMLRLREEVLKTLESLQYGNDLLPPSCNETH